MLRRDPPSQTLNLACGRSSTTRGHLLATKPTDGKEPARYRTTKNAHNNTSDVLARPTHCMRSSAPEPPCAAIGNHERCLCGKHLHQTRRGQEVRGT
eukprot:23788-Eustigmatos_ZCMA.PRE.1